MQTIDAAPKELALSRAPEVSAMQLLQSAVSQGADIGTIERLAKLQREMVEWQAKVDFSDALQRVQSKMVRISADCNNPQTRSRYASYAQLDRAVRPIYSAEGFSLSFNTADAPQPELMRVTCDVARGGHERIYQIDMSADGKGAKGGDVMTKNHAAGAAASYGMRYLLKMIFNIAVGEDDVDGNSPGAKAPGMPEHELVGHLDNISAAMTLPELQQVSNAAYKAAQGYRDQGSMAAIIKAKDRRKKELGAEAA